MDFPFEYDQPLAPTNLIAATSNGQVTLTWNHADNTSWYQVWVGTLNPSSQVNLNWYRAFDLGCLGSICTLDLNTPMTAGVTHNWYVQGYGPGGISTGGLGGAADGWAEGTPFTP